MSDQSLPPFGDDAGAGFSPGAALRGARLARGLSIEEVAHALKLAPRQVEAIEADAFEQLRGMTFARGFVRNYARHLGLDPEPLVAAIAADADPHPVELAPVSNARGEMPVARSSVRTLMPAGITLLVLVAIALAGWKFGWFRVPAVPVAQERSEAVAPSPDRGQGADADRSRPVEPGAIVQPAPAVVPVQPEPAPAAAAPPGSGVPTAPAPAAVAPAPDAAAKAPPAPGSQRLSFQFDQDSWIEVRDGRGKVVHSQLHKGGSADHIDVAGSGPFALVVGNASNVRLRFNDKAVDLAPHIRVTVARLNLQ